MSQTLHEKMAQAVLHADATIAKAAQIIEHFETANGAARQLIPATIQQLQKAGMVAGEDEVEELKIRLQNHDSAVHLLKTAAEMICEMREAEKPTGTSVFNPPEKTPTSSRR